MASSVVCGWTARNLSNWADLGYDGTVSTGGILVSFGLGLELSKAFSKSCLFSLVNCKIKEFVDEDCLYLFLFLFKEEAEPPTEAEEEEEVAAEAKEEEELEAVGW